MRPRFVQHVFLVAALLAADVGSVGAQTAAELFDSQTLHELRLYMNSKDLRELRERYLENIYYPADLRWRNIRVRNVGVRVRGFASRSATKPGLRIEFNRYTRAQKFLGLEALKLDNLVTDPALAREWATMALFERVGQPASRESFCRLYINNMYQGVYAIVEEVDDPGFLARVFGDSTGYLFEYKWMRPYFAEYLGDELESYKPLFEARTHRLEPDSILYSPIRDLFREVNQADDDVWRDRVAQYVDLAQFVTHVAIEMFMAEKDGVLGDSGMANFYLYRPARETTHRVIVWDKDNTFQHIEWPILRFVEDNVLMRRALAYADLRTLFLDVLEQCARLAAEDDWLESEVTRVSSLIADAAHEDIWKPDSNEVYDEATEFLKEFARTRSEFVLQEVEKARAAPSR